jgi:hypothetical protein
MATISAVPPPSGIYERLERWADNVSYDLKHGTDLTGIGSVLQKMGAHGVYNGNPEAVGDFMASLPLGLLKAIKGAAELPQSGKRWQGTKDVVGGGFQAATIPSAFVAPEAGETAGAVLDKAGNALVDSAGNAARAIRKPFSLKAVQEALQNSKAGIQQTLENDLQQLQDGFHGSVRDLFDKVAQDAGVQPKPAPSLNDVASNLSAAVKAKASALYKQLDAAIGGGTRFQTFDEQLSNVRRALRNSAGIDPDSDGRLIERINDLEDVREKAFAAAKANGVDPNLIHSANAAHRQAMALGDLSKHIQASISGLRSDVAQGVNAAEESLSPAKLASRVNRLYNSGRLQQALGDSHADELLRGIESTRQRLQDAAQNAAAQTEQAIEQAKQQTSAVNTRRVIGSAAAASIGAPKVWTIVKHLLGE